MNFEIEDLVNNIIYRALKLPDQIQTSSFQKVLDFLKETGVLGCRPANTP